METRYSCGETYDHITGLSSYYGIGVTGPDRGRPEKHASILASAVFSMRSFGGWPTQQKYRKPVGYFLLDIGGKDDKR